MEAALATRLQEMSRRGTQTTSRTDLAPSALTEIFRPSLALRSDRSQVLPCDARILPSTRPAFSRPRQGDDDSKPAVAEFQAILASSPITQPVKREQPETRLQPFVQLATKPRAALGTPVTQSIAPTRRE
jgi:hypothetical protein